MAKSVTLIISGSIAAIKTPELIRQLKRQKIGVHCIVTRGGQEFVSLKEIEKLSGNPVSTDLFSPKEKKEMWHIRFSRETDLIVVAPASANLIAKMANGIADDMASATLLASDKSVLIAPAMNTYMWVHPATQRNVKRILKYGAEIIEPGIGMLACGEVGAGRMAEPADIVAAIAKRLNVKQPLTGMTALVTSGPTHEPLDPVRYIGNRSSGKQGHAIARALSRRGASVTLVTGPTALADPQGMNVKHVTTADQMLAACEKSLPADIAICAAAVADWKAKKRAPQKMKKNGRLPALSLIENPDILKRIATRKRRPKLVVGFAAETNNLMKAASAKRKTKGCDWIVANDVSGRRGFDADDNQVALITAKSAERWKKISKDAVAEKLVDKIVIHMRKGT